MHTGNFALEQKRLLACYRHSSKYSDVPQTEGNRMLLDEGTAIPVFDKDSLDGLIRRIYSCEKETTEIYLNGGTIL